MSPSSLTSSSVRPDGTRAERRRRRTRYALVQAARKLMAEHGFERTTVAGIAEAADLGLGTFYCYFKNKEDILDAVLDEGFDLVLERITRPETDHLAPRAALRFISEQFVRAARENADLFAIVFRHGPPAVRPGRRFADEFRIRIRDVLERGARRGDFRDVPAAVMAQALAGLYVQALLWRDRSGPFNADRIIDLLVPFVERGLHPSAEAKETPP